MRDRLHPQVVLGKVDLVGPQVALGEVGRSTTGLEDFVYTTVDPGWADPEVVPP